MTIFYKEGVRVRGTCPEILEAQIVVSEVFAEFGYDCVVTSGVDSKHGETSLHPAGRARDYRSHEIPTLDERRRLERAVKLRLAPLGDFDFLLEYPNESREHFHLEYQPKTSAGFIQGGA